MLISRIVRLGAVLLGSWYVLLGQGVYLWDCNPNRNGNSCEDYQTSFTGTVNSDMFAYCQLEPAKELYVYATASNHDCQVPNYIEASTFQFSDRITSYGDTMACSPPETKVWECWQDTYSRFGGCTAGC